MSQLYARARYLQACSLLLPRRPSGDLTTHCGDLMENWLMEADTESNLLDFIAEYAYSCGGRLMMKICNGLGEEYQEMARDQNAIGWRRFMEGMICKWMQEIQRTHHIHEGTCISPERWAQGLILKLLEATHGQWI
jgi:hypothetical protein